MTDIRLTSSGDLDFTGDNLTLIDGQEAIAQDITVNLQLFLGEWFLDTRIGMPYYEKVLGKKPRIPVLKNLFQKALLQINGVESIGDLDIEYTGATRVLSVSFVCVSTEGTFTYDKEFIV